MIEQKIIKWAEDRNIFEKSSPVNQQRKTVEEMGELFDAVNKGNKESIRLEIGDIYVTLILQSKMQGILDMNNRPGFNSKGLDLLPWYIGTLSRSIIDGDVAQTCYAIDRCCSSLETITAEYGLTLSECASAAYEKISKRKGKMKDGIFVKEIENAK